MRVHLGLFDCISCISYSCCAWQPNRCGLKVGRVGKRYMHGHFLLHCNLTQFVSIWSFEKEDFFCQFFVALAIKKKACS